MIEWQFISFLYACDHTQKLVHNILLLSAVITTTCNTDGDIELSNAIFDYDDTAFSVYSFIARVDYCYNGTLSGICDAGWSEEDAVVACRRYGNGLSKPYGIFPIWGVVYYGTVCVLIPVSEALTGLPYGPTVPVIENVMCNGSEYSLDQCLTSPPGQVSQECIDSTTRAAGVQCYQG